MIVVFTGQPGAGKSLKLAQTVMSVLRRNKSWFAKTGQRRFIYTNLKFSQKILDEWQDYIREWKDTRELTTLKDVDVIWDEMATSLDATQWQNMSLELKRWLQQHRKYGVEIYGTTQDFAQVDKSARRLVSHLYWISKIIGSRDPSPTSPKPKYLWGVSLVKELDPLTYNEEKSKFEPTGLPSLMFYGRDEIETYDTRAEVKLGQYPPLRHIVRTCEDPNCDHIKTSHI